MGAGLWKPAVRAFRLAWVSHFGDHLAGLADKDLGGLVDPDLLAFVQEIARNGVAARSAEAGPRWRTKPHRSVLEHLEEAYQKMWKDAHRGRALLCSAEHDAALTGVLATP